MGPEGLGSPAAPAETLWVAGVGRTPLQNFAEAVAMGSELAGQLKIQTPSCSPGGWSRGGKGVGAAGQLGSGSQRAARNQSPMEPPPQTWPERRL